MDGSGISIVKGIGVGEKSGLLESGGKSKGIGEVVFRGLRSQGGSKGGFKDLRPCLPWRRIIGVYKQTQIKGWFHTNRCLKTRWILENLFEIDSNLHRL